MQESRRKVLLVEDDPSFAQLVKVLLTAAGGGRFDLEHVDRVSAALRRLNAGPVDAVLLDLGLPDSQGLATFQALQEFAGRIPVIVMTGQDDDDLALEAVWAGAQDFLVKGRFDDRTLEHALRYAIERVNPSRTPSGARLREPVAVVPPAPGAPAASSPPWEPVRRVATLEADAPVPHRDQAQAWAGPYGELLEAALARRQDKGREKRFSEALAVMANRITHDGGTAADIVRMHEQVLNARAAGKPPHRALNYLEEGRRLVLELTGAVLDRYREKAGG